MVIASLIGIPLGVLAGTHARAGSVIGVVIDTLQTLPSFVYLIPVAMLLRIGDFTALAGTRNLGQEAHIALTKAGTGRGLLAGSAFIAIMADRIINASARAARERYGQEAAHG